MKLAQLLREEGTLVLQLSPLEKLEGVHGDIRVPVSAVQAVTVVEDVIHAVHGLRMPGSRVPGVFAMGTFISSEGRVFAIVHHQDKRGVKIQLAGEPYDALIVSAPDPAQLAASLNLPA